MTSQTFTSAAPGLTGGSGGEGFAVEVSLNVGGSDHDLYIQLPAGATGGDLYRLLGAPESGLGLDRTPPLLTIERTGQALRHDQPLIDTTLMTGDRLLSILEPGRRPSFEAEFLTGPRQGHRFSVPGVGETAIAIGRATASGFDDPSVSREHAMILSTPSGLLVEDNGSTNGTVVNGQLLADGQRVEVHPGDVIELGHISWRFLSNQYQDRRLRDSAFSYRNGSLAFQQAPRAADPKPPAVVQLPSPPPEPTKRRFPLAAALLPVLMGGAMAFLFSPYFALFMLMSPIMMVWTYVDDKRSGRKSFQADRETFLQTLEAKRLEAADVADQMAAWHRRRTPNLEQIARWVRVGSKELWARRPRHDDFLFVAVGTARGPSAVALSQAETEGGAPELRRRAAEVGSEFADDVAGLVSVDLRQRAVIGITGRGDVEPTVTGLGRSVIAQLAGLRSYRDLQMAIVAPDHAAAWQWCKWLPHTRAGTGSTDRLIAGNDDEANQIFDRLMSIATERADYAADRLGTQADHHPHYVVVLHPPVGLSPSAVARFLELAPTVGMSVVFLAADRHDLPGDVAVHMEVSERGVEVHDLTVGSTIGGITPWVPHHDEILALARDLAPVVDKTVSNTGAGIPSSVSLFAVHEDPGGTTDVPSLADPAAIARRWSTDPRGLVATIGVDGSGPITVDLQADGPHALVAGTTGAGKSEFLQTLIADLAANYSPTDLNFILIDYKGGSAFRQCRLLPHTVGFVTDLDEHLAERALTSLRAELRHREHVLAKAEVSDLTGLQAKYRHTMNADLLMPSLVIVIDEFAALKTEVPCFVDGLVDVAQRGRSMGVHMILATQKPGGVITPQIDANTNIRVALRVANDNDSRELIGVVDAAAIATDSPGRALLKIGGGSQLVPFQSAYVGGLSIGSVEVQSGLAPFDYRSTRGRVTVVSSAAEAGAFPTRRTDGQRLDGGDQPPSAENDLAMIVDAVAETWGAEPRAALRQPWLPTLPSSMSLEALLEDQLPVGGSASPLQLAIGLADHPERQSQDRYVLDLAAAGHVAVYGAAGSGKSTLLRSVVASASIAGEASPGLVVYGIDIGGGLAGGLGVLDPLPLVADIIPGSDHERVQLLLQYLKNEVSRRQDSSEGSGDGFGGGSSEGSGERSSELPSPYIVVLIDGFGPFWDMLEKFDYGRQAEDFVLLMSQARSVGIHMIVTAGQRSAIPYNCLGSVGLRLVQRLSSADEYQSIGLRHSPDPDLMPPGRTMVLDGSDENVEMQVALLMPGDGDTDGAAWLALADRLRALQVGNKVGPRHRRIEALSDRVSLGAVGLPSSLADVAIGLSPGHEVVAVNLVDDPTLLIAGGPGSGRSTTLASLAHQLMPLVSDRRLLATKRTSALVSDAAALVPPTLFSDVAVGEDLEALAALAAEVEQRSAGGYETPMFIAVDDADTFFDNNQVAAALTTIVLKGRDAGVVVVMTASSFRAGSAYETWIRALRSNGHGLLLQPNGDKDQDLFDVRFPRGSALRFPVGRGYLIVRSTVQAVQVATPDSGASRVEGRM